MTKHEKPAVFTSIAERIGLERDAIAKAGAGLERVLYRFRPTHTTLDLHCDITLVERDGAAAVVLTERQDNPGRSVTNTYEQLATEIYALQLGHIPPGRVAWIEHYDRGLPDDGPTFDRVKLGYAYRPGGGVAFYSPQWTRLRRDPQPQEA